MKLIAIIAMTIDHLAWMGIEEYSQAETPTQIILHCIGRLIAPIMFFFFYYPAHLALIGLATHMTNLPL